MTRVGVSGQDAGRLLFLGEVAAEVVSGQLVEVVFGLEHPHWVDVLRALSETDRSCGRWRSVGPGASPFQKGTLAAGTPGSRNDLDPIGSDVGHPPGAGSEDEHVAHPRFVHHFFVEFTDPAPVRENDPKESPVGNGPGVGDRQLAGSRSRRHGALDDGPN